MTRLAATKSAPATFSAHCVCAAYVKKQDVAYLKRIGVADSKKMSDDFIKNITPLLLKKFSYSQVSLTNEKYNELVKRGITSMR
jgi:ribonuclease HIII